MYLMKLWVNNGDDTYTFHRNLAHTKNRILEGEFIRIEDEHYKIDMIIHDSDSLDPELWVIDYYVSPVGVEVERY